MQSELSFKDPAGFLIEQDNSFFRFINTKYQDSTKKFIQSKFYKSLLAEEKIVSSDIANESMLSTTQDKALCLKHSKIPYVSYPWEWSFAALKDAALLTLEIQERALEENFTLKDATSLNIVFDGTKPIFVDILSFEKYKEGMPWVAYGQFCRSFLFPLMITKYLSLDFNEFIQYQLGEISVEKTWKLLGFKHILKPGVFLHVFLQNLLQQKLSTQAVVSNNTPKIPKQILLNNIRSLKSILKKMEYPYKKKDLLWTNYKNNNSYNDKESIEKQKIVENILSEFKPKTVVDLGANTGVFSALAAKHATRVIAVDSDCAAINFAYTDSPKNISYFICDISKPTPSMGFNLKERKSFLERVQGDFFLALALIHHLRISASIPLEKIIEALLGIAHQGIIEWVDPQDIMVKQMLLNRENVFDDYTWENFLKILENKCKAVRILAGTKVTRKLCLVEKK